LLMKVAILRCAAFSLPTRSNGRSPVSLMLVVSDLTNDGVQAKVPDHASWQRSGDRRSSSWLRRMTGLVRELPSPTRVTNDLSWSALAAAALSTNT
jgi:hypothetical protein